MANARRRGKKDGQVRANRNHGRSRNRGDSNDEEIDINITDDGNTTSSSAHSNSQHAATAGSKSQPNALGSRPAPSDPGLGSNVSHSRQTAHDINHFFRRGNKSDPQSYTVCLICEAKSKVNPTSWKGPNFTFSRTTSNTTLRGHLENIHETEYLELCAEKGWRMQLPKKSKAMTLEGSAGQASIQGANRPRPKFCQATFLRHLINFIVADDQSIRVVECHEFRDLLLLLREDLQDSSIPHRSKIRESIIQAWRSWFGILKNDLKHAAGQISFTADIWSDQALRSYLCITGHWIARDPTTGNLSLKTALLAFHRICGKHDGKNLAKIALHLLDRAGATKKIGHWTLDNASNNATFMLELGKLLRARDIQFDHLDRRIMCFPHVINICCSHIIEDYTDIQLADVADEFLGSLPPDIPDRQILEDAGERDPVALGRNIVRILRASGQRRANFDGLIREGNAKGYFKSGNPPTAIQLQHLQLLRDVRTRWDSVYFMIRRLREMRPAIDLEHPLNQDLLGHRLTEMDWLALSDLEIILEVPHRVQQTMSGESHPILCGAIPAFEMFMTSWERLGDKHQRLKKWTDIGLAWATQYYARMDRTRSYIIAMVLNPTIRMTWIRQHWERKYILDAERKIKETMKEYRAGGKAGRGAAATQPAADNSAVPAYATLAQQYGLDDMHFEEAANPDDLTVDQEFQSYAYGPVSPKSTNTLKHWEVSEKSLPTFYKMSLDFLPIQASAVPSERVFSSSAETDTKKRNRISPILMEALQMLKFALKKDRLDFMQGWITPEWDLHVEQEPDENQDLLATLLGDNVEDAVDRLIQALGDESDSEESA